MTARLSCANVSDRKPMLCARSCPIASPACRSPWRSRNDRRRIRMFLFSPIMGSSSPAARLPKSPIAPRAYAMRFPHPRVQRLSLTSSRFPRSLSKPSIGCRKQSSRARCRARSEKSGDSKPRIALSRSRGLSRTRPRHGDFGWRAPAGAGRSPAISNAGLARSRNRASSFSDEERGRDGAMSCGCCGSHPRRRLDVRPDRRRGARIDELGSRDLQTVYRQMSLRPDACMRYRN